MELPYLMTDFLACCLSLTESASSVSAASFWMRCWKTFSVTLATRYCWYWRCRWEGVPNPTPWNNAHPHQWSWCLDSESQKRSHHSQAKAVNTVARTNAKLWRLFKVCVYFVYSLTFNIINMSWVLPPFYPLPSIFSMNVRLLYT
jgi:hypothetical protein